jgi:hypothetical protein
MSIISNQDMEIFIEPEESYTQSNSSIANSGTISLDNLGNLEQLPIMTIEVPNALTSLVITNITTGISATIPSTTISAGVSLLVYNDAIYKNNLSTSISATFTGIFNLRENASNTISFNLVPSAETSVNVDTTWLKPNGNAVLQCFAEGFSITKNKSQIRKKSNILNHYTNGYATQDIDYDFSVDRLFYNDEFINETDDDQTYRITYQTNTSVGAIYHQIYHLSGCHFNNYGINQASTQQTDACKERVGGKGCKLFQG